MTYRERITEPGPKKLLALDGGGIRGVLSLEILAEMEDTLRRETGAGDDFVLADFFHYVAGTSTGAIIAAGLARGMPVGELRRLYAMNGAEMFRKAPVTRWVRHRFRRAPLEAMLQRVFGAETTLGDDSLRTLLMMVMRNATTDSPWPLSNNPGAMFNAPGRPDSNLQLKLWQLVRASTAAPTYFAPETVTVGDQEFQFVDGGVTTLNNPAFQLFLMATHEAYGLRWPTGEDRLLLVSVGTGTAPKANASLRRRDMQVLFNARAVPAALMAAALHEQDTLCRVLGRCRYGAPIDLEVGDLRRGPGILEPRLFSYVRYNADLSRAGLDALGLHDVQPTDVERLDSVAHIGDLQRVGMRAAQAVRPAHFAGFLGATREAGS